MGLVDQLYCDVAENWSRCVDMASIADLSAKEEKIAEAHFVLYNTKGMFQSGKIATWVRACGGLGCKEEVDGESQHH